MTPRLLIAIPFHGRRKIAELCIPTVIAAKAPEDTVICFDDNSAENGGGSVEHAQWISSMGAMYRWEGKNLGIEAQRRLHLQVFSAMHAHHGYTHLYFTDADSPHDPAFRQHLLDLQSMTGLPVCGYDTEAHVRLGGNTTEDDPTKPYIIRKVAPGISYLLNLQHVEKIMQHLETLTAFDWQIPALLGHRFCVARQSQCSHVGWMGLHDPGTDIDGGDIPRNPTSFLINKRAEIIAALRA